MMHFVNFIEPMILNKIAFCYLGKGGEPLNSDDDLDVSIVMV